MMTQSTHQYILDGRRNAERRFTKPRILADGEFVRVPMMLMDGMQRAIASDSQGGATHVTDAAETAYEEWGARLRSAWKNPTAWCTDAKPAEQRRERQPDPPARTQRANDVDAQTAFEQLRERERNAWRTAR
jgi:hypothetical protein